jgi:hypothetical protein
VIRPALDEYIIEHSNLLHRSSGLGNQMTEFFPAVNRKADARQVRSHAATLWDQRKFRLLADPGDAKDLD